MSEPSEKAKAFAERMKLLREERQLSRMAVGKATNIHINSITGYEQGRIPTLENLKKIKDFYNVSYEYLFAETDIRTSDIETRAIQNKINLSEKSIEILEKLNKDDEFMFILDNLIKSKAIYDIKKEDNH